MADVWILTNGSGEGKDAWKSGVKAVILPNHKIIAKTAGTKELLEAQIEEVHEFYHAAGHSGKIPSEQLFEYLEGLHQNMYHIGFVVPVEEAREYIKLSGGFPGGMEF